MTNASVDVGGSGFRFVMEPLMHRRFGNALAEISGHHEGSRRYGAGGGLLLTGPSGSGKSRLLEAYEKGFPRQHGRSATTVPVLRLSVPPSPTSKSLAESILYALGDPSAHRGSGTQKTNRVYELFRRLNVELVMLDEFHHLYYTATLVGYRDLSDWLKNFMSLTKVAVVGCGLPEAALALDGNEQLARRFSARIRWSPFSMTEEDFLEFRGILKACQAQMPIPVEVPLIENNMARRLWVGSYGLIDYVLKILEGAVAAASRMVSPLVTLEALSAGFKARVWADVPELADPFHPESVLRPLDRVGEVFYLYTQSSSLGSPVARRTRIVDLGRGVTT